MYTACLGHASDACLRPQMLKFGGPALHYLAACKALAAIKQILGDAPPRSAPQG